MLDLSSLELSILTVVGVLALLGYYMGNASRRIRLPAIIGYMVMGVVIGPSVLNVLGNSGLEHLSFITQIALGFVAFSIGSELSFSSFKKLGAGIFYIILAESFVAAIFVFGAVYAVTRDLPMALIFAAMAPASAPAGTVAVIQECKSRGNLTKALYAVVGLDDGLAIIIFGFAAAVAKGLLIGEATGHNGSMVASLLLPLKEIGLSIVLGGIAGFGFSQMARRLRNSSEIIIVAFGTILVVAGLAMRWHLSLIMSNMMVGMVFVNTRRESLVRQVMTALREILPLLFVLFFALAGAHLELATLPALGGVGLVYILGRSGGKLIGAYGGALIGRVEEKIRKYVGIGILSQAGVAIGLSLIVHHEFGQLSIEYDLPHAAEIGVAVLTTITATSIFFEIIGPILTKIALTKAGEIPKEGEVK